MSDRMPIEQNSHEQFKVVCNSLTNDEKLELNNIQDYLATIVRNAVAHGTIKTKEEVDLVSVQLIAMNRWCRRTQNIIPTTPDEFEGVWDLMKRRDPLLEGLCAKSWMCARRTLIDSTEVRRELRDHIPDTLSRRSNELG